MHYFIVKCALLWVVMCSISVGVFGVCSLDVIDSSKQWKLMADEGIVSRARMIHDSRAGQCLRMTLHML